MIGLHAGPHNASLWLSWSWDPLAILVILLGSILYARGLKSLKNRRYHSSWRPWLFYGGIASLFAALVSPLDPLAEELLLAHMVQHLLLLLVAPPLILLGAPMIPVLRGIPLGLRRRLVGPFLRSAQVRWLLATISQPLVAWGILISTAVLWHVPFAYVAALENPILHTLEHLSFSIGAHLFWWNVIDPLPLRPKLSYLIRVPYIFTATLPNFVLAAFLTYSDQVWYKPYLQSAPSFGLTAQEDQQLAGVIMWIPGSFILGTALVLALIYAVRSEQKRQEAEENAATT